MSVPIIPRQLYQIAKVNFPFFSNNSLKHKIQTININTASQDKLIKVLRVSEPLARKIVSLRDSLNGRFKDPKDLFQLPKITNLELEEWKEEGIVIIVD